MKRQTWRSLLKTAGYCFGMAGIGVFALFPLYWMGVTSVLQDTLLQVFPPIFFPRNPQFIYYVKIFYDKPLLRWIMNTIVVASGVTTLSIIASVCASYSLSRFRFLGRKFISHTVLVTQMVPATLLLLPLYLIFVRLKLFDTLSSLVLIDMTLVLPIAIWILKGFFDTIPVEIEEAGYIDGCGSLKVLSKIVVPLSLPGLLTCVLQSFIIVWHEFLYAVTLTEKEINRPISVGLRFFIGQYTIQWNEIMAAAVIGTVPAVAIFLLLQKWLVFTYGGAIKG